LEFPLQYSAQNIGKRRFNTQLLIISFPSEQLTNRDFVFNGINPFNFELKYKEIPSYYHLFDLLIIHPRTINLEFVYEVSGVLQRRLQDQIRAEQVNRNYYSENQLLRSAD